MPQSNDRHNLIIDISYLACISYLKEKISQLFSGSSEYKQPEQYLKFRNFLNSIKSPIFKNIFKNNNNNRFTNKILIENFGRDNDYCILHNIYVLDYILS